MRYWVGTICALVAVGISGCQTDGPRDASGKLADVSTHWTIAPGDAAINIPLFFEPSFVEKVETWTRDNIITHTKFYLRGSDGVGRINVQTISGGYRFNSGDKAKEADKFSEVAVDAEYAKPTGLAVISRKNEKIGVRGETLYKGKPCIIADAVYRLNGPAVGWPSEAHDTKVRVSYCGAPKNPAMFDQMLTELDLVKDRAAYRAALDAKGSATKKEESIVPFWNMR